MNIKHLKLRFSQSYGQNTYGWPIVILCDGSKNYKTMGGGYDGVGTVLGDWVTANYQQELSNLKTGMGKYCALSQGEKIIWVDGGCGVDAVVKIMRAIGLGVQEELDYKKRRVIGFYVLPETVGSETNAIY